MASHLTKTAAIVALLIYCAGCPAGEKSSGRSRISPGFATIPITSTNLQGGGFYAGILMVSHETGAISVCWKICSVIGHFEPTDPRDLVLSAGKLTVHLADLATGHVVWCAVETDEWVSEFKSGHCDDVGTAVR